VLAQAARGQFAEAVPIAREIEDPGQRATAFISIAQAQVGHRNVAEASANWEAASSIAEVDLGISAPFVFIQIAQAQDAVGQTSQANKSWEKARQSLVSHELDLDNSASTNSFIARQEAIHGHLVEATKSWTAALQEARSIKGPVSQDIVLANIARDQGASGQWGDALRTMQTIRDGNSQDRALGSIARSEAEVGKFSEALRRVQDIRGQQIRSSALVGIALAQSKAHRWKAARNTVALCLERHRLLASTGILIEYAIANNPKLAQQRLLIFDFNDY